VFPVGATASSRVAALRSTLSIRRVAVLLTVAVAAVGSLAILHLTDTATQSPAVATARASAGSFAAAHDGLIATLAPRSADPELFDGRRPDDPTSRTTQVPFALVVAACTVAGLAAGRALSRRNDVSPRGPLLAIRGSRAPPVLSP